MAYRFGDQVQCRYVDLEDQEEIRKYESFVIQSRERSLPLPVVWVNGQLYSAGDPQALGRLVQELAPRWLPTLQQER